MRRRWLRPLLLSLILIFPGCSPDTAATRAVVRRDSAGIRIVENGESQARTTLPWTLDTLPEVDIGTVAGDEPYQLFRVTGGAQLADGRIVVVNAGTQEIRFFDRQGVFLYSVGGRGEGPGEYQFPELVPSIRHDSLWVNDRGRRLTRLDGSGEVARSITPRTPIATPVGILANRLVTSQGSARAGPDSQEAIVPNDIVYELVDLYTWTHDTIAQAEGFDLLLWKQGPAVGFTPVPFDVAPSAAAGGTRLYVAPGEVAQVLAIDTAGALREIFRIVQAPEPLAKSDFDHVVEQQVDRARDDAAAAEIRRRYGRMPLPTVRPVFQDLLVDAAGHLWLEAFRADARAQPEWIVMDASGVVLGRIATPRGVTLWQIGDDFLLGSMRDDSDVEHVVRYRLRRS